MKNNNNRLIYTGAFLAATLAFGQVVQADSLVLSRGNQTISRDTVVDSVVVGHTLDDSIAGSGHLIVNNGAQLVNNGTGHYLGMIDGVNFNAGNGYLGLNTDSMGVATITGASSLWQNEKDLYVGRYGTGSLNIEKGGKVTNAEGVIGDRAGSIGTVTVTDAGSLWQASRGIIVGVVGQGTLDIRNGGRVSNEATVIGISLDGHNGNVTVTGVGSLLESTVSTQIEYGSLNIENGGKVINGHDGFIGANVSSIGTATVTGTGSRWDNLNKLYVGGWKDGSVLGNGSLIINDGGAVSATNGVTIWSTGSLSGNGGTIEGDVINYGLISPGNSPGVLTITGDLTLESDSVLLMEIFGPTAYDQLIIGGNFVAGGILELDFGGYMPEFDVPYDLFQVAGGMSGDFSEIKFLNPAAGFDAGLLSLSFAGGENGGMFQLIMANNGDPGNNTVPEPASGLLIGLGGLAMLMLRRRSPKISLA